MRALGPPVELAMMMMRLGNAEENRRSPFGNAGATLTSRVRSWPIGTVAAVLTVSASY